MEAKIQYICTLDIPEKTCVRLMNDGVHCDNHTSCGFCKEENPKDMNKPGYVRQERWYEKYYK